MGGRRRGGGAAPEKWRHARPPDHTVWWGECEGSSLRSEDMKRRRKNDGAANACRPSTMHSSESARGKDLKNAKAQRSLASTLRKAVHEGMEAAVRRHACLSCAALYSVDNVERRGPFRCNVVRRTKGFQHVEAARECYSGMKINVGTLCSTGEDIDIDGVASAENHSRMYVNVCTWCKRLWTGSGTSTRARNGDRETSRDLTDILSCPTLNILPWNEVPLPVREIGDMEGTALSCISLRAKILFGGGAGNVHDAVAGDFKYGEDSSEGREGLLCGELKWTPDVNVKVLECLRALLCGGNKNPYVGMYMTSAELWTKGTEQTGGEPLISPRDVEAFHLDGQPDECDVGAVFRTGLTRLWKTRKLVNSTTAARCIRRPGKYSGDGVPEDITFDMDVEGRSFPCLYVNGLGSWDSRDWEGECQVSEKEWLEKRLWSIDPRFRRNRVWLFAHYDRRQKDALYAMPNFVALDAGIGDEEAEATCLALRRSRTGSHDVGIEELRAGVRGIAAASDERGDANLFVTITMSESDMPWLQNALASVQVGNAGGAYDEPGVCAYYFSHLVRVLITVVFGDTRTFGDLDFYAYRLENQSQRANKLHAHCILRVRACEREINDALTANLADLCPSFRVVYEPRARHQCGEKCTGRNFEHRNGEELRDVQIPACKYGFPVTEYCSETYSRSVAGEKQTVYRRTPGMERVVPYYPVLKSVYPAHGADMAMTSTVMAAYTGKSYVTISDHDVAL